MKLCLIALLPFTFQADSGRHRIQHCYTGAIKIGEHTFTKEDVMAALELQVNASVTTVANGDQKLADFLKTRGNCQADCLRMVMVPTLSTLYGKLGKEFIKRHKKRVQDTFIEALFGAFRACYPHPPREEIRKIAERIEAGIGRAPISLQKKFPEGVKCQNQGHERDFPLTDFLRSFDESFVKVMEKRPEMQKVFHTQAKDCQRSCLETTVPISVLTFFLTGSEDVDAGVDSLTGAIHACFPGVPHEDINALVSETKQLMKSAEATAETNLSQEARSFFDSMSFEALCAFASLSGVVAAVIVYGAMAVGTRFKHAVVRQQEIHQMLSGYHNGGFGRGQYEPPRHQGGIW